MYIRRPLCVFSLLFVLFLAMITHFTGRDHTGVDPSVNGRRIEFRGTVKNIEYKNHNHIIHIKDIYFKDGSKLSGKVLMYMPDQDNITEQIHIGAEIKAEGEFNEFKPSYNRGQFDLREYYALKGYSYAAYNGVILGTSKKYNRIGDSLYRVRERTKKVYEHYLDGTDNGVLEALVLADKGNLDSELKDRYSDAGIAHILALSGLHIATMGFILIGLLRKTGMPIGMATGISSVIMILYCIMTGMPISAVRALIMFLISAGALLIGRSVDLGTSAAIAALIMLIVNPDRLCDASFLMSFSSILGIGLVYPYLREVFLALIGKDRVRRLKRSEKRPVRFFFGIITSLLISLSVQLTILPFTMWFYYTFPLYGILLNLIVVPLAEVLLVLAVMIGLLGNLTLYVLGTGSLIDVVTEFIALLTHLILKFYDFLTGAVSNLPGSLLICGRPLAWQMILYYVLLAIAVAGGICLKNKDKVIRRKLRKGSYGPEKIRAAGKRFRLWAEYILIIFVPALFVLFVRIREDMELSALYVGQGQCVIIHGREVPTIMYDCGSTDEKRVGEYTVVPFLECLGFGRVDTVFISHLDTDHVSGLLEILSDDTSHIKIGRIVIPADPAQKTSANYEKVMSAAGKGKVPVYFMKKGDEMEWKNMHVECMSAGWNGDLNDGSLVLSLCYHGDDKDDFRALLTGDISSDVEDMLSKSISGYDYLQVAHHGSASAANERFIKAVHPRIAVVSAGIDNQYGHPHAETMNMLKQNGIPTYVTSSGGEIRVCPSRLRD